MAGLYPEAKFVQGEAQQLYMFQVLRDQMSAAVRLGIVGPMEATRRQLVLYVHCEELLAEVAGRPRTHKRRAAHRSSTSPRAYTTISIRASSKVERRRMYGAQSHTHAV